MIRFSPKRSVKKGFAGWLVAAAVRLDGDEDRIDLAQLLRVVKAKDPAAILLAVLIEDAEVDRRALISSFQLVQSCRERFALTRRSPRLIFKLRSGGSCRSRKGRSQVCGTLLLGVESRL